MRIWGIFALFFCCISVYHSLALASSGENSHPDLAVRNLFDEDAREPSPYDPTAPLGAWVPNDYPLTGMKYWIEFRTSF